PPPPRSRRARTPRKPARGVRSRSPGTSSGISLPGGHTCPLMPEERLQWWHRLPREGPVDRIEALVNAARGRRVVHVGFVDELMEAKQAGGVWLHERLGAVASSLVGLDLDQAGVEAARAQGYEAHAVDVQSAEAVRALGLPHADVVIAGELIEHLDAPGPFLRAMHELAGELV